jgi:transcriptional regulator with XRE-family HTH domain
MVAAIGTRIRQARLKYGMTQAELARRVGISKTAMNDLEQGKTVDPRLSHVVAIADHLRLSVDALIGRTEERPSPDQAPPASQPTKRSRRRTPASVG